MKKIRSSGFYDFQFAKCVKRTGRWRGKFASLYMKYKRAKKVLPKPYVEIYQGKPIITVPKEHRERPEVLVWEKIVYQPKLS